MQEIWVRSLDLEDPLEKGMAIDSSILAPKIPGTEEPGGLQSMGGHKEFDMTEQLSMSNTIYENHTFIYWKIRL